mmetsp:Transcript_5375/g.9023  ORF Transcript_5375/g.9023 Transcript_5375/m.9023 type:complete len:88 (+) Transcript_5375:271-534(+)
MMMTGLHKIRTIKCIQCRQSIGWTYVFAYEESEKYKVGKFIIERFYLAKNSRQARANAAKNRDIDSELNQEGLDDLDPHQPLDDSEE